MAKPQSEDILILNTLTPGITAMKPIYDAISMFCQIKKSLDKSCRFNIVFFQDDGPNYLENFTLNPEYIINAIQTLEPVIVGGNIGGGIFLAISIIIDVFKKVSEKSFRLIILTDSGSPKISRLYIPVLETMIYQIRNMPFFIDIIRIDARDEEEDAKLMRLAALCNGKIYHIVEISSLPSILEILASNSQKYIKKTNSNKYNRISIPLDNQQFYINLADEPIELKKPETCSICFEKDYNAALKCPNCGIVAHKICWALWSEDSNIGIPYVFRCHNCYNLIKLDEKFVEKVKLAQQVKKAKILPQKDISSIKKYLEKIEHEEPPKIVHIDDPMGIPSEEFVETEKFIENPEDFIVDDSLEEVKFILCPHCFKMITNQYKRCPNCHHLIEKQKE